jgi:hypothetical protein
MTMRQPSSSNRALRPRWPGLMTAAIALATATASADQLPVAWWTFDEGQGTVAHDSSGNSNDGTISGAQWTVGRFGGGLFFDGHDSVVTVSDSPSLDISNGITITAWVNGALARCEYIHPILWKSAAYRFGVSDQRAYAELSVPDTVSVRAARRLNNNVWYFLAMTYDKDEGGYPADLDTCDGLKADPANPVIPVGGWWDWDATMREIGNVLFDVAEPDPDKRYKAFYSGYRGAYQQNKVYIGYAYSADGMTWTKYGKIIERALEDPYVVQYGQVYYLFAEDKQDVPFRNIRRYQSTDCVNWVDDGDVFDIQSGGNPPGWESQDVSSPVVWVENGVWYLLYEGRGGGNSGMIGLATSPDGLIWTRVSDSPIFLPGDPYGWDGTAVASDDILKLGDQYYMFYHGYGMYGRPGWLSGIARSTDLVHWTRSQNNPISSAETVMILKVGDQLICFAYADWSGIGRYYPYLLSCPHLYVNGVEDSYSQKSDFQNQPIAIGGDSLAIGRTLTGPPSAFWGVIDEVRIFDRALTPAEIWALYTVAPDLRGDVNCDGQVNFGDINPFVLALTDPTLYEQTYPDCPFYNRDINGDGVLDFRDINPFVAVLASR